MRSNKSNFSPSINIKRDENKAFEYIVTPNAEKIYESIISNLDSAIHSYTIIGSYGTGKSSFLIALMQSLLGVQKHFKTKTIQEGFKFDLVVGRSKSIVNDLISQFNLDNGDDSSLLEVIKKNEIKYRKKGLKWFLIIDEFGKYLEHAAKHNPDAELYFIQQLAEIANEKESSLYLITTLHQSFDSYAFGLNLQQRKEWDKVSGRLKEIPFNEPVEQLLLFASEHLAKNTSVSEEVDFQILKTVINNSNVFPLKSHLNFELFENLYPLEPLSAAILALALQAYGQNERSLFTFLNNDDELGLSHFSETTSGFYNLSNVFDYLIYNHHSFLSSKYNPHYLQWNAVKNAIERVESIFDEDRNMALDIVKIIGLLNIFGAAGATINDDFLNQYLSSTKGYLNTKSLIESLKDHKILRFRSFKNQYILFAGTDLDIEVELSKANGKVEKINDVVPYLLDHFSFPYLPAKRSYYEKGTPRFFEVQITNKPIIDAPLQPIDGIINLIVDQDEESIIQISKGQKTPVLYGCFRDVSKLIDLIHEIHKVDYVLGSLESDKVAEIELKNLRSSHIEQLDRLVIQSIYGVENHISWIFDGTICSIKDQKSFSNFLSIIIDKVYSNSPTYKNELINKHKVSPAIYRPRRELLRIVLENRYKPYLGFERDLFPPEKTIYLSLMYNTSLHREENGIWDFYPPKPTSELYPLWEACETFFDSTSTGKKPLSELLTILQKPPIGLKLGLLEIWIPLFMILKGNDCALYYQDSYVPEINTDIINLVFKNPKLFSIKAFRIDENKKELFRRYRSFQNLPSDNEFSNKQFVETIRPFLLKFNELNEYGRKTNKISPEARKLRDAIKTATDPESAFFHDFPNALGYSNLEKLKSEKSISEFITTLYIKLSEIENSYNDLINRLEIHLINVLGYDGKENFEVYQPKVQQRYHEIKQFKLPDYQKKLLNRLISKPIDREKWLSAIGLAVVDKPISKLKDDEEETLFYNLETRLRELDSINEIGKLEVNPQLEEAYHIELLPLGRSVIKENFKIAKETSSEIQDKLDMIKNQLTGNKETDLSILIQLMEGMLRNGK